MTVITEDMIDMTPSGHHRYNIDLQSQVPVPQNTPKENNRNDTASRRVHIHAKTQEGNIKLFVEDATRISIEDRADI